MAAKRLLDRTITRMRLIRPLLLATVIFFAAAPAYADFTFFVGSNQTPSNRAVKGFALGSGQMIAFEFEYANTSEDVEDLEPGLRTFLGNVLLQTPFSVFGFQPYGTIGTGVYRETLDTRSETAWSFNSGVGVKITLFGPLKARADYRVLKLNGEPLYGTVHRVYSGVHLAF
jgi:hypothetical protein